MRPRSSQTILSPVAASSLHTIVPASPAPTTTTSTGLSFALISLTVLVQCLPQWRIITVRYRLGDELGHDRAAGARTRIDDHRPAPAFGQFLTKKRAHRTCDRCAPPSKIACRV